MNIRIPICFVAVFLAATFAVFAEEPSPGPGQHAQTLDKEIKVTMHYLLYLPEEYGKDPSQKWPLMLFLHGAGERGDDLERVKKHGPPKLVAEGKQFPFIIVSPQCPSDGWWSTTKLFCLLDDITERYPVDKDRVYLTGLSMGGFATWSMAMEQPERFAAIIPVCGGGEPILARRYRKLPIWVFHGAKDSTVPVRRSEEMVEAVKKAGGDVKFTVYPEAEHDSWTETYNNPEVYDWLLSHKR
jgi:predicted peptidase